jgi:hypothetical protein
LTCDMCSFAADKGADVASLVLEFIKSFKRVYMQYVKPVKPPQSPAPRSTTNKDLAAAAASPAAAAASASGLPAPSTKRPSNSKSTPAIPNLQVKLALEGKAQVFTNPLADVDWDKVMHRDCILAVF